MADIKNTAKAGEKEVKTVTPNSTESKESANTEPIKAGQASGKSIGDQSEAKKDTNESAAKADKPKGKTAVVTYLGASIWKDEKGNFWSKQDAGESILAERQMLTEEYEKREDLKFMVGYGEMKVTFVG